MTKRKELSGRLKKAGKETGKCLKNVAWQTCKCALWIACAPCICCAILCVPNRRRRRGCCVAGRAIPYALPEFPTPRPRALSLPLIHAREDQQTLEQPHSDFMTKLPLEIRRMIYKQALSCATIHLNTRNGRLNAKRCWKEDGCDCGYFNPNMEQKLDFSLALLRTCRIM